MNASRQIFPISLVILEVMWGPLDSYRPVFPINPNNHSGRRLHKIMPGWFVVGNACPGIVDRASARGTPDPEHLAKVFQSVIARRYTLPVVVICGKVARETFQAISRPTEVRRVMFMPHPAARGFWSNAVDAIAKEGLADESLNGLTLTKEGWI